MSWDAVVVGAGPNGLVAANRLLDAGWSVLVLEAQPDVGGAVRSDRDVHPDFVHDTFSAFYPLAATSPTIASFGLEDHGLVWRHAPAVLGHPLPDGSWAVLHRDREATASGLEALCPGDGQAWLDLCAQWDRVGPHLVGALLKPFPPVRHGVGMLAALRHVGGLDFVKTLLTPAGEMVRDRFGGEAARLLVAGNAAHADIPLDAPGSGLMGLLLAMLGQTVGFPVPEGGAGELTQALARRFRAGGGEIRTDAEVVHVEVADKRAVAVRTADGERHAARRAVVADVLAPALYLRLLDAGDLPDRFLASLRRFQLDPGTVKVDWALDGPIPWTGAPDLACGTVHVADSVDDMTRAMSQVHAGAIPASPFMLTGQMTASDPTRSLAGTESFWAYTHVPQRTRSGDAGDGGIRGVWDHDDCERFADRMQARLERLAPGFADRVVARRVLGPREMEARNANLVGGALNGGTAQLHQQLVFRPVPGLGRAETPVRGLYLGSASAHPGGGVHGACGDNAARAALAHDRVRGLLPGRR
ncbi:phytoene desaturase family protein [Nocardioides piscis]|uniref:Pyridine nucleotide-disulfide oxidoreductase domain-containing protein 2 n=1 Tax=Nocardioides piscis TaxID=2714938 RepID=A0A6G7YCU1_9ACTN|nr:NAD(P)/FAD-dependent oxidoreductase [Nocardioides piscis]QIK74613.1 NAD(P)/FAD-dependent oxidoreductase [Nocardioides piscis]